MSFKPNKACAFLEDHEMKRNQRNDQVQDQVSSARTVHFVPLSAWTTHQCQTCFDRVCINYGPCSMGLETHGLCRQRPKAVHRLSIDARNAYVFLEHRPCT